jgi:hypothetical protein
MQKQRAFILIVNGSVEFVELDELFLAKAARIMNSITHKLNKEHRGEPATPERCFRPIARPRPPCTTATRGLDK